MKLSRGFSTVGGNEASQQEGAFVGLGDTWRLPRHYGGLSKDSIVLFLGSSGHNRTGECL